MRGNCKPDTSSPFRPNEASRFTDLRSFLEQELKGVHARIDRTDQQVKAAIEKTGNILSAYIGELENRLERRERGPGQTR